MWPYRKIVTQSLTTPLVIARIIFYFALLMLLPLPFMVTSDSFWVASGRVYYLMFSLPIAMVLMLISSLMAIMIAKVEALNNR
ncbi:hypothetical protein NUT31_09725 [Aeromonas sp. BC14]|uniref:hypothetical protein n=1 Tax=Aeromonas hydrophila TaxID=644 RepID=UPI001A920C25|nr:MULTISPECIES: hypothetical protein [Aeromonas]EIS3737836.1 hypothetical protein [Aeromonas hydrophila]MBO0406343.1 hypothetical protein [Aeromonas hydrophila]UCM60472.1 hypothetical protein LEO78_14635 [Aeromonas hydrophila]UNU28856.1 hypothetical protein GCK65_06820 [Aeromonas hydrophila]WAF96703.1 hypothetical protein NUT31_09725 [Aeromonas sp. BC14]